MPDIHAVTVPKWGLSMEEGTILTWHVAEGADVSPGAELVDVETTKITNTVEAQHAGRLCRILARPGQVLPCGQLIAVIADGAASAEEIDAFIETHRQAAAEADDDAAATPNPVSLDVGGRRHRYLDIGRGGVPLLFVHGFGGDLENWMFNQPVLAAGRRTIALDLPGHGESSKDAGDGSPDYLADALAGLLNALGTGPVHVVAHSFGAAVAAALFRKDPAAILSMAAIAPAGFGPEISRDYIDGFIAARRRSEMSAVVRRLFANEALATSEMAENLLRAKRLDGVIPALQAIAARNFARGVQRPVPQEDWGRLGDRLLVIWGAEDRIIPSSHLDAVPPAARRSLIQGAGHMPHLEKSDAVNTLIATHLSRFHA